MRPKNMPSRVERRQLRARMGKGQKVEPELDQDIRNIRTKKLRKARVKAK